VVASSPLSSLLSLLLCLSSWLMMQLQPLEADLGSISANFPTKSNGNSNQCGVAISWCGVGCEPEVLHDVLEAVLLGGIWDKHHAEEIVDLGKYIMWQPP
jgi:hypothetical protein